MRALTADKAFTLPSGLGMLSYSVAEKCMLWIPSNMERARAVEEELVKLMRKCFVHKRKKQSAYREVMWSVYHSLRTSKEYLGVWERVTKEVTGTESCPAAFIQSVGHFMFKELVKTEHVKKPNDEERTLPPINYEEMNALR